MEFLVFVLMTLQASMLAFAIPVTPPTDSEAPAGSLDDFLNRTNNNNNNDDNDDGPQGFSAQIGRDITVEAGQDVPLDNFQITTVPHGWFIVGASAFEVYSGLYCPAVDGYYHMSAMVQLTTSIVHPSSSGSAKINDFSNSGNATSPLVQVTICHNVSCSNPNITSLDVFSSVSGRQTITVSGVLKLAHGNALVVRIRTNAVTRATVFRQTSFSGFLLGRSSSSTSS